MSGGKLTGGLSEASKEALESLVAMGDTSVPGIEASDINDGDIMARTREKVNNQGQFQFIYIPDDGSDPIESDWIQQDFKKKVILGWCEGVKNAIISRGQAGMAAANEAALDAKLRKQREEDMADAEANGEEEAAPAHKAHAPRNVQPSPRSRQVSSNAGTAVNADPTAFIEDQLSITRERLIAAEAAQQDIIREVMAARRDYEKWSALAGALGGADLGAADGEPAGLVQPVSRRTAATALTDALLGLKRPK